MFIAIAFHILMLAHLLHLDLYFVNRSHLTCNYCWNQPMLSNCYPSSSWPDLGNSSFLQVSAPQESKFSRICRRSYPVSKYPEFPVPRTLHKENLPLHFNFRTSCPKINCNSLSSLQSCTSTSKELYYFVMWKYIRALSCVWKDNVKIRK